MCLFFDTHWNIWPHDHKWAKHLLWLALKVADSCMALCDWSPSIHCTLWCHTAASMAAMCIHMYMYMHSSVYYTCMYEGICHCENLIWADAWMHKHAYRCVNMDLRTKLSTHVVRFCMYVHVCVLCTHGQALIMYMYHVLTASMNVSREARYFVVREFIS